MASVSTTVCSAKITVIYYLLWTTIIEQALLHSSRLSLKVLSRDFHGMCALIYEEGKEKEPGL